MGVDEVGVARCAARRAHEPGQEERQREHEPRPAAEVADDPVPVGDPKVAEVSGRDDLDVDPGARTCSTGPQKCRHVADRGCVTDEAPGHVILVARIRGGHHDDLHSAAVFRHG